MTRIRNFSEEHKKRQITRKRLVVDLNREKAEKFICSLKEKNITFASWIEEKIDQELGEK